MHSEFKNLKIGDKVMLLPIYTKSKHLVRYLTPFSFAEVYSIGKDTIGVKTNKGDILVKSYQIQPIPTKFDGWEKE